MLTFGMCPACGAGQGHGLTRRGARSPPNLASALGLSLDEVTVQDLRLQGIVLDVLAYFFVLLASPEVLELNFISLKTAHNQLS